MTPLLASASADGAAIAGVARRPEAHDREQSCWALVEKIASRAKAHPEEQGLSRDEALAQGKRCGCRGADDYCGCQNVPDATTRAERRAAKSGMAEHNEGA